MATNSTAGYTGRSASAQAGFQIVAVLVTIGIAIIGGSITGKVLLTNSREHRTELKRVRYQYIRCYQKAQRWSDAEDCMYP